MSTFSYHLRARNRSRRAPSMDAFSQPCLKQQESPLVLVPPTQPGLFPSARPFPPFPPVAFFARGTFFFLIDGLSFCKAIGYPPLFSFQLFRPPCFRLSPSHPGPEKLFEKRRDSFQKRRNLSFPKFSSSPPAHPPFFRMEISCTPPKEPTIFLPLLFTPQRKAHTRVVIHHPLY